MRARRRSRGRRIREPRDEGGERERERGKRKGLVEWRKEKDKILKSARQRMMQRMENVSA